MYVKQRSNKIDQFWRCQYRKCNGRLRTSPLNDIREIDERGSHNHVLSDNDNNKATTSHKIIELAESTKYSTSKVISVATNY